MRGVGRARFFASANCSTFEHDWGGAGQPRRRADGPMPFWKVCARMLPFGCFDRFCPQPLTLTTSGRPSLQRSSTSWRVPSCERRARPRSRPRAVPREQVAGVIVESSPPQPTGGTLNGRCDHERRLLWCPSQGVGAWCGELACVVRARRTGARDFRAQEQAATVGLHERGGTIVETCAPIRAAAMTTWRPSSARALAPAGRAPGGARASAAAEG